MFNYLPNLFFILSKDLGSIRGKQTIYINMLGVGYCRLVLRQVIMNIDNEITLPCFVSSLSLVSRRFLRISRDPILWQTIKLLGDAISETETVVRQGF